MADSLPPLPAEYALGLQLIDEAHAEDPNKTPGPDGSTVPYELHYARKMTKWLALRCPSAPPVLQLACRAQHFRRFVDFSGERKILFSNTPDVDGRFLAVAIP